MSPINWGNTEPTPDKKANFQITKNASCTICGYTAVTQRQTKAMKMVDDHVRRKHPDQWTPPRKAVETEDATWIPVDMSPVGKLMDEDADTIIQKRAETGEEYDCLICKVAGTSGVEGVRLAMATTVHPQGEPAVFTFSVCEEHRGGWYYQPNHDLIHTDGMFRFDKNKPEEPYVDEEFENLSPGAQEKVRKAIRRIEEKDDSA